MTPAVRPPDLEMQVRIKSEDGRTCLIYTLHSPTGRAKQSHLTAKGPDFKGSLEQFQRQLLHKVEQLGERLDVDGTPLLEDGVNRKLVSLGRELWRELIPSEIRTAYREFRQSVQSWMIISDEPWIPWELLKPYDDSRPEDVLDDDSLALRFELTRWLAGESPAAREVTIRSFAALRTAELPQEEEKEEMRLLDALATSDLGLTGEAPSLDSSGDLLGYLESCSVQLLHFMGHGIHDASQADESAIPLPDGSAFRPGDLEGPVATRIRRNQPLVFMNTCSAAQQGFSLTRLGGWTSRWIGLCGCGALVAPLWPVRNQIALSFAHAFYQSLTEGATLGKAALEARRQVYKERPGDPSVLAYAVYGHPHARVRFGMESSVEETLSYAEPSKKERIKWPPRRRRWRHWWNWAAAACLLAVVLHVKAGAILDALYPMNTSAVSTELPKPEPSPTSTPSLPSPPVKGPRFVIFGGSPQVNAVLKAALTSASKDIPSGWTITLDLNPPTIATYEDFGTSMVSCRLTVEASARGAGSTIDLGQVSKPNSQTTEYHACKAAAESLAKDVVSKLIQTLGSKGER